MNNELIKKLHSAHTGVLEIDGELPVSTKEELGAAYTPGVAEISKLIANDHSLASEYTVSGKLVAIITDGSAVLGLGNIGPQGGLPVVEGKALLYKKLANVDAIPLALDQVDVDEFVQTVANISKSFAGIHLEDIAAPKCFEIEKKLAEKIDIPVYHDDQEGTAIVVLAGLINAAKVVHKNLKDMKVVVNGVGASGLATVELLFDSGVKNIILVDQKGVINSKDSALNDYQYDLYKKINYKTEAKNLAEAMNDADAFIGLSVGNVVTKAMVSSMNEGIVFALANPKPEIDPADAKEAGAAVVATGSSQYPNQVNNILAFPGLFKGLLENHVKHFSSDVETSVAEGLASMIESPKAEKIIPGVFDDGVVKTVSDAITNFVKKGE